jgi:hypothetical protein
VNRFFQVDQHGHIHQADDAQAASSSPDEIQIMSTATNTNARIGLSEQDAYWRENFSGRPYVEQGELYERYAPAYRFGWESRARLEDRSWDDAELQLRDAWAIDPAADDLDWESARSAVRDAWDRVPMEPGKSPDKI